MNFVEMDFASGSGGAIDYSDLIPLIPTMTSSTAPSGKVTQSSSYSGDGGYYGFHAFDAVGRGWLPSGGSYGITSWLKYEFPDFVNVYAIVGDNWVKNNYDYTYDISVSTDDVEYTNIATIFIPKYRFGVGVVEPIRAKFIKFTLMDGSGGINSGYGNKFQVFGK